MENRMMKKARENANIVYNNILTLNCKCDNCKQSINWDYDTSEKIIKGVVK